MAMTAKITSKGQITVPNEVRRALGVGVGDRLAFNDENGTMRVTPVRAESPFERYRGIGNPGIGKPGIGKPGIGKPGIGSGKRAILKAMRELRGE